MLLQRQEFAGARQLLREALDDPALARRARRGVPRACSPSTFGAEVGQLTAQAILSMQEAREGEALESLKRAEEVLAAIPPEALPPTRRDEVDQRLWWGYAELGSRRLEAGDYEEALDPLIHALRFDVDRSRASGRDARGHRPHARGHRGAARACPSAASPTPAAATKRRRAPSELRALLRKCVELGITEGELWAAYTRIQRLCEELGLDEPA